MFKQALLVTQHYAVLHMKQFSKAVCCKSLISSPSKKDGAYLIYTLHFQGVICFIQGISEMFNGPNYSLHLMESKETNGRRAELERTTCKKHHIRDLRDHLLLILIKRLFCPGQSSQRLERQPAHWKVSSPIPSQGHLPALQVQSPALLGHEGGNQSCFSFLSPPSLSL